MAPDDHQRGVNGAVGFTQWATSLHVYSRPAFAKVQLNTAANVATGINDNARVLASWLVATNLLVPLECERQKVHSVAFQVSF